MRGAQRDFFLWADVFLAGIVSFVGRFRTIFATLLLAIWPAVTSHALLQQAGVIHVVQEDRHHHHDEDDGSHPHDRDNHVFADGDYTSATAAKSLEKPDSGVISTALLQACSTIALFLSEEESLGPAPPGAAPPLLQKSWHFLLRTALPVRAPSSIS